LACWCFLHASALLIRFPFFSSISAFNVTNSGCVPIFYSNFQ
jgi:hypothetical protein